MPNLTDKELSALRGLMTELCPAMGLALAEQINSEVTLDVVDVTGVSIDDVLDRSASVVSTLFSLTQPVGAESLFLLPMTAACLCYDLLGGGDGSAPPETLAEDEIRVLAPTMQELMRGLATALSNRSGDIIDLEAANTHGGALTLPPVFALEGSAAQVELRLTLSVMHETTAIFILTPEWVRSLLPEAAGASAGAGAGGGGADTLSEDELAAMLNDIGGLGSISPTLNSMPGLPASPSSGAFPSFASPPPENHMPRGMEMIMDIPLDVTVELGRVRMLIKDVLELASGSIVELDRVAGEPVDLLVNGRLVAKGEVVVIEDNFGIRITEIVSQADRLSGLGKGR